MCNECVCAQMVHFSSLYKDKFEDNKRVIWSGNSKKDRLYNTPKKGQTNK